MENIHSSKRFGTGIVIVLAGIILLLANLELLPWPWRRVLVSWPMILVGVGLINFIHRQRTVGLIFTLIGVYFLLPRILHNFDWYDFWRFWPVLLIVGGLSMLDRKSTRLNSKSRPHLVCRLLLEKKKKKNRTQNV